MTNLLLRAGSAADAVNPFLDAFGSNSHPAEAAALVEDVIRHLLAEGSDTPLAVVTLAGALASAVTAYRAAAHAG